MTDIMEQLQAPFPAADIEWRVQRAMKTTRGDKAIVLAYVTNRAIMNRLDEVFGPGNWQNEYREWRDKGVLCGISARVEGDWITKYDGAGETAVESIKGGFSDSMKRAAVQWGIGRYLYNLEENWVDVKERGQNYISSKVKVNGREELIKGYWDTPSLPEWALPKNPITQEQVGTIKIKAMELAKLRGKKDTDIYSALKVPDITNLNEGVAADVIAKLDKWIKQARQLDQKGA